MDQYPDVSIKNPERERRGAGRSIQIAINHGNHKCPTQWKKYLSDGSNKEDLQQGESCIFSSARVAKARILCKVRRLWFTLYHSRDGVS